MICFRLRKPYHTRCKLVTVKQSELQLYPCPFHDCSINNNWPLFVPWVDFKCQLSIAWIKSGNTHVYDNAKFIPLSTGLSARKAAIACFHWNNPRSNISDEKCFMAKKEQKSKLNIIKDWIRYLGCQQCNLSVYALRNHKSWYIFFFFTYRWQGTT